MIWVQPAQDGKQTLTPKRKSEEVYTIFPGKTGGFIATFK